MNKIKFIQYLSGVLLITLCSVTLFGASKKNFQFTLVTPQETNLTVNQDERIAVKISYNSDAVNEANGWIMTSLDGTMAGMSAATTMESPFTENIPASYLRPGTHTLKFLLMPTGETDESAAFDEVILSVTVRGEAGESAKAYTLDDVAKKLFYCNTKRG
jgi:hypothetical protein